MGLAFPAERGRHGWLDRAVCGRRGRPFDQAVAAGAMVVMPLTNQFWGDRSGQLKDPFGHRWLINTHIEDVSPEESDRRGREWMEKQGEV